MVAVKVLKMRCSLLKPALGLAAMSAILGGCSSAGMNLNPFNKSDDFDRTFMRAAQTWDLNKDGAVTCDEWKQYVASLFREADVNGDNSLDAEEWKTVVKNDRLFEVANLAYFDANGDGRVSIEEMTGKQNRAFAMLDKNNDCSIDRTEMVQVVTIEKKKDSGTNDTSQRGPN